MLVTCARTERPHGNYSQFGTGVRYCMYRIGGRLGSSDASCCGALLGYHLCSTGLQPGRRNPAVGQLPDGSLTGAVASRKYREAPKGIPQNGRKPFEEECKGRGSLTTATPTGGAGTKVGLSDPVVLSGMPQLNG